ncbi:hypothetical protein Halru_2072 [Halovivax ruber XH-70]|uniref:Uncharacterized protein n=1 Tax=Halovivax ruber (strain DSM 18193 / JCM 13892 / XH-70) TaxID=797302 RepID=L0ID18_HALRX|nr:hypothetical protein [Halovivax ruber]AGB16664.1 hypothetical protein Halru_2072 [Halovivax ruber XH-70]
MQFKPLPDPPTDDPLDTLERVRSALPSTPEPNLDCCARVMAETTVETRDEAGDWLTFCRALELAAAEPDGYRRTGRSATLGRPSFGSTFRDRVLGADEVIGTLEAADDPLTPNTLFARLDDADAIPRSARRRHGDQLEAHWTDRIRRILDWAVAFDNVERICDGYRA